MKMQRIYSLFWSFCRISSVAVGGGLTMLPLIDDEFVEKRKWMSREDMVDCVAAVQSMPGIIGVNISCAVGYRTAGVPGVLAATFGMVLPPFLAILAVAALFMHWLGNIWVEQAFAGVRAAVTALILLAGIKMGKTVLKSFFTWIVAGSAFLLFVFLPQINVIWVILGSGLLGALWTVFQFLHTKKAGRETEK